MRWNIYKCNKRIMKKLHGTQLQSLASYFATASWHCGKAFNFLITCERYWPADHYASADSQWEPSRSWRSTCQFGCSVRTPRQDVPGTPARIYPISSRPPSGPLWRLWMWSSTDRPFEDLRIFISNKIFSILNNSNFEWLTIFHIVGGFLISLIRKSGSFSLQCFCLELSL